MTQYLVQVSNSCLCMPGLFSLLSTHSKLSKGIGMKLLFLPLLQALNLALFFLFSFLHFFFNSHPGSFTEAVKKPGYEKQKGKAVSRQRNVPLDVSVD